MKFEEKKIFKIFVDFDGTISKTDVGEQFFLQFGNPETANEIINRWISKEINSKESWYLLCDTVKNHCYSEFENFIDSIEIDNYFKKFVEFCRINEIEIYVVSDGFDYYINRILKNNGLEELVRFSNKLTIGVENNLVPSFPYSDEECLKCANCKRNHIINNSDDSDYTIFVGDGYSDTCPAQYCDFIFAKNSLLKYCELNRVSYYPYKDFNEVIMRVEDLKVRKKLKKRHQAELKRKEVYLQG